MDSGAQHNGQTVAATAVVSVSAIVILQSLFARWRSTDGDSSRRPRDVTDGIAKALSMPNMGPRITIESLVSLAGEVLGGIVYYFSVPHGPGSGDQVEISSVACDDVVQATNHSNTGCVVAKQLKLLACSNVRPGEVALEPPEQFMGVLDAALVGQDPPGKDGSFAVVVRSMGEIVGVFLVDGPRSMDDQMFRDMQSASLAFAAALEGRLDRVRQLSMLDTQKKITQLYAMDAKLTQQKSTIVSMNRRRSRSRSIDELVQGPIREVMNVERATIWFVDEAQNEMWAPPKPDMPKGMTLKLGSGLDGAVCTRARETKDLHKSMICTNDPKSCPIGQGDRDLPLSLLSFPILANTDRKLLGMIQLINKLGKADFEDAVGFSESDVQLVEVCAKICADELVHSSVDQLTQKADMDHRRNTKRGSCVSFLNEYYCFETESADSSQDDEEDDDDEEEEDETVREDVFTNLISVKTGELNISDWRIDYWRLSESDECLLFLQSLARCGIQAPGQDVICKYFKKVRSGYRDNPYHNFHHAISTVHYSYKLLETSGMEQHLQKSDMFALLFGALCHDLDHRGYNTAFEVITRGELALRYNDNSPLENHHCSLAFQLAFSDGDQCNIFKDMSAEFYAAMRKNMVAAIIATDMKYHGQHVKRTQDFKGADLPDLVLQERSPKARKSIEGRKSLCARKSGEGRKSLCVDTVRKAQLNRALEGSDIPDLALFLCETFLHTADIGNPMMPCDISSRWSVVLAEEFTNQVVEEKRLGLPITPFMDGLTDPVARAKSGLGFTDFVVFPLVDPLFKVFDDWAALKKWQQENRQAMAEVVAASEEKDA